MGKKMTAFKTKGMNRDLSVSAFNPEFAFENINLRLSTNEGNTLLSWVNEKGPASITIVSGKYDDEDATVTSITGTPIGTAILNHQLVIFTTSDSNDYIYKLKYKDIDVKQMVCIQLYEGNLKFDAAHPIETLVYYETDYIQKVYWTDGINQPRIINIAADKDKRDTWEDTSFDFAPAVGLKETLTVTKAQDEGGLFAPGVIQYCFTYVTKYGQQSNIVTVSPLEYLVHADRGASPEEKVTSSFKITITGIDPKAYDYIRLYSIQRTSVDLEPIVKLLEDIDITKLSNGGEITYIDNGTTGTIMDPTELLYVGCKELTAYTMADKDNTLFLGNITQKNANINKLQEYFMSKSPESHYVAFPKTSGDEMLRKATGTGYAYNNFLSKYNAKQVTTFKAGETYRFGIQLQKVTGEWSEPIWVDDNTNKQYPNDGGSIVSLAYAQANINFPQIFSQIQDFDGSVYKKVRPVIVYPTVGDRNILCQGVLNPTVFNVIDRKDNSPFAQASWYFRPFLRRSEWKGSTPHINHAGTSVHSFTSNKLELDTFRQLSYYNDGPRGVYNTWFSRHVIPVYALFAIIDSKSESLDRILQSGKVGVMATENGKLITSVDYWGAIKIPNADNESGKSTYVFIRKQPWPNVYEPPILGSIEALYTGINGFSYSRIESEPFYMYEGMHVTEEDRRFYYTKPNIKINTIDGEKEAPDYFLFNFYNVESGLMYTIYYISIGIEYGEEYSETNYEASIRSSALRYEHYSSLYDYDDAGIGKTKEDKTEEEYNEWDYKESSTQIEIQGAVKKYKDWKSKEDKSVNSNTQFFVDQSIVTLNSPDIDFDTEVQTYGTDGLGLRIVGYIPIKYTAAAFSLRTSSAMLEVRHNLNDGADVVFGVGKKDFNVQSNSSKRLVAGYLWNDSLVRNDLDKEDKVNTADLTYDYLVHPWQRTGSLNNDFRSKDVASSWLSVKKESNLLYSPETIYDLSDTHVTFEKEDVSAQLHLTENAEVINIRLDDKSHANAEASINYYPNIDKALYNTSGYKPVVNSSIMNDKIEKVYSPISMKYKSTSHAVLSLNNALPNSIKNGSISGKPFWGTENLSFTPATPTLQSNDDFLWIGELYKEPNNRFGGKSIEAIRSNKWLIAGDAVDINSGGETIIKWTEGDTYYQRYDCLKTYAFTPEDTNQIVEVLSFMVETHVNIDGRYDKNRGQIDNTNMKPDNFNALNPIYSQKDNFFTSQKIKTDDRDKFEYPNWVTFSKNKTSGADVDLYTNITLASSLEMDGDKGEITSLNRFNNNLIAFQESGISSILFNENTMLSTTQGVPVEIANSGKVEGKNYLSNTIGCSNKWSIAQTPSGIYFIDSNDKNIYMFNGQLQNLSLQKGFNTWSKQNIPSDGLPWNPVNFGVNTGIDAVDTFDSTFDYTFHPAEGSTVDTASKKSNFVSYYDRQNQDVLFINRDTCLAYSEKLGVFTSFYSYENTPYFCNLDNTGLWLKGSNIFMHQAGEYGNFFGACKPYSMTLVGNPEPMTDKIFTNLEFRACVTGEGKAEDTSFTPYLPFDSLETWNEYQHGITALQNKSGHDAQLHHTDATSALKRKFRIWRCDIPRDNAELDTDEPLGITRFKKRPTDRMRNPWIYLKLLKGVGLDQTKQNKAEIHDVVMTYFG